MKNISLSLALLFSLSLAGCGKKTEDPGPPTTSVDSIKISKWSANSYYHCEVLPSGVVANRDYTRATMEVRFSPTDWTLTKAADTYGPGFTKAGTYTYDGTTLALLPSSGITYRVTSLTKDQLSYVEIGPTTLPFGHIENEYTLTRR